DARPAGRRAGDLRPRPASLAAGRTGAPPPDRPAHRASGRLRHPACLRLRRDCGSGRGDRHGALPGGRRGGSGRGRSRGHPGGDRDGRRPDPPGRWSPPCAGAPIDGGRAM
ncbi:MAG: hypothetical protein AVDCRST_MAG79-1621, partial [uncultured Thermoleophilia bacterium]